ncbi:MAG: hypothetical protein J6U92_01105 [Clostridia bacterium]|nr:hypothetical protein [Clostridia bacterium]
MFSEKIFNEKTLVEKDYEKITYTTSSIASWLIKSVIFVILLLVFR